MATLNAKKLGKALNKAKSVGRAELPFVVDGLSVVLQSLGPEDYVAIADDTNEYDDLKYLTEWRSAHLCRSIVEIDGENLRGVDFIEADVEERDPKGTVVMRGVKFPRHIWIRDNILSLWGREAVEVAMRKFSEVVEMAEKKSAEGVTFTVVDETPEDKFRRQLGEALETASDVPGEIVAKTFAELGLAAKVTAAEADGAKDRLARLAAETPQVAKVYHSGEGQEIQQDDEDPPVPNEAPIRPQPQQPPQSIMRQPLNRPAPVPVIPADLAKKAQQYAALELDAELDGGISNADLAMPPQEQPAAISGSTVAATPEQLRRLQMSQVVKSPAAVTVPRVPMDEQPKTGLNPRFRPPAR